MTDRTTAANPGTRKIAFICCTNDPDMYRECEAFIRALTVPAGYEVETIPVVGASGMAAGYNEGMKRSDARIKVYLHQDVLITYRSFLTALVRLFDERPDIGLIGMTGARTFPMHGHWWEAVGTVGLVYGSIHGRIQKMDFGGIDGDLCVVEAVDGLLMATQYDVPWREDVADGWHFYDISQCMEFLKAGKRVAVPSQEEPWCIHDCGVSYQEPSFKEAKRKFMNAYGPLLRERRRRLQQHADQA